MSLPSSAFAAKDNAGESQLSKVYEFYKALGEPFFAMGVVTLFFLALTYAEDFLR